MPGSYAMDWQGFSLEWYGKAFSNPLITEALMTSLIIAGTTAVLSAIIGTLAALGLERMTGWLRACLRRPASISPSWCRASSSASRR